jgi:hypothetical protein
VVHLLDMIRCSCNIAFINIVQLIGVINGVLCEIILKRGLKIVGRVEWINLAQNEDKWRVLVNLVINHKFP